MFPFLLRFSFFSAICKVSADNHFAFLYFFFLGLIRVVSSACAVLCLVSQPCPTLCDPVDCSLPSSSVHAYSPSKNNELVCQALLQGIFPTQRSNPGLPRCRWVFLPTEPPVKPTNTGVGSLSLLQGIFLTQESNQSLLHCSLIL